MNDLDKFIELVLRKLPADFEHRNMVATDLRGHYEAMISDGIAPDQAIMRLGEPSDIARELLSDYTPSSASILERYAAFMVDAIIYLPIVLLVQCPSSLWCNLTSRHMSLAFLPFYLFFLIRLIPEIIWGTSLGKVLFGLRVQGLNGSKVKIYQVIVRNVCWYYWIMWIVDGSGLLFTKGKKRLGDFVAGTVVVKDKSRKTTYWMQALGWIIAISQTYLLILGIKFISDFIL